MRRNKPDVLGKHPWKSEIVEGMAGVSQATITGWFQNVYEAAFSEVTP
jgi:hypothetical protein